ncbi:PREDICTED: uncharacterized protein LOC109362413 [Lupinus angustifolius]|uniref:uncharacterized protein LOC109362413 n=1 Tax=Lupinus angustifolius TaxID=3871 RepID=UPI00092FC691|nr:PREDICTED: uncharacterized protein LOC109362413 [Lupinus angustifolius]
MATPSSPKPTPLNDTVSPTKKPQPIPWTHQETLNLIRAYQEKWYALKRGPLRSSQWEEVAVVVAARCGYDFNHPSKSAIQCRHKMEKLRQRHRAEKHRLLGGGLQQPRGWLYFGLMDELERGPMPISARPLTALSPPRNYDDDDNDSDNDNKEDNYFADDDDKMMSYVKSKSINYILNERPRTTKKYGVDLGFSREHVVPKGFRRMDYNDENYDDDDDDDDDDKMMSYVKSKSINYILNERPRTTKKYGVDLGFSREHVVPKGFRRMDYNDENYDDDDDDSDDENNEDEEKRVVANKEGLILGLTEEIKDFGERFIAMENLKMRMMKDTERYRVEMENKRIEMILKSQQRIVDSIGRAFGLSNKKMKIVHEI